MKNQDFNRYLESIQFERMGSEICVYHTEDAEFYFWFDSLDDTYPLCEHGSIELTESQLQTLQQKTYQYVIENRDDKIYALDYVDMYNYYGVNRKDYI